ncbi:MAG TPA: GRP family sugar transporter [Candidatus Hydrogenedentes bacterium]|nr:GRP family sugar transporter [Candidatus Hydrogenedentota bacterium]
MVIVQSYALAVVMCVITMLCWGSWANTQKLASREWKFQLFYWDYALGVLLLTLLFAFTLGSFGSQGRSFLADLAQADRANLLSAFLGGVIFNFANILLVVAIDIAGMSVAFPVGIGLALVLGVIDNFREDPAKYQSVVLFLGVACVAVAIILNALAYRRVSTDRKTSTLGVVISIVCGISMGFFYGRVASAMATDFVAPEAGKLTPYTALVCFAAGLFASNFILNTIAMRWTVSGETVDPLDYFRKGNPRLHLIGLLGGAIWGVGMSFSIIAGGAAGYAISYGLGQGATLVAALWGVFIWREFKGAPKGTAPLLGLMFLFYVAGLALVIAGNRGIYGG